MDQYMEKIFFEIHSDIPRQGPGDFESTKKAFLAMKHLPQNPQILDIGCGPGEQALDLSKLTKSTIVAVDNHQPYIDYFQQRVKFLGLADRIFPQNGDMFNLQFAAAEFDVIWSEGAIYIIGFEKGLKAWQPFLKKDGYLAVTHIAWLKSDPPKNLNDFWMREYPAIQNVNTNLAVARKAGYEVVDSFVLPEHAWWENYYNPLQQRIQILKEKYKNDEVAAQVFVLEEEEMELYRKYSDFYGYVFYILQKK